ncbi:unnamed protein product [Schistocephalus solidus]|uniref:Ovule protein n=1 Tax=Schistocephalus solidus TaxID=70667 RepID=A0A183TCI9_SCHSO|nr:unnamed protein product [Schistocephalus solidus]
MEHQHTTETATSTALCLHAFTHRMGLLGHIDTRMGMLEHMFLHQNERKNTAGYTTTLNLSSSASVPNMLMRKIKKNILSYCIAD